MTGSLPIVTEPSPWAAIAHAPLVTAEMAQAALLAMEVGRSRHMGAHRAGAERIAAVAAELGRADLQARARLVLADIDTRSGMPLRAGKVMNEISVQAEQDGDGYLLARSHFLLATVQHALGDLPTARIHGIRGVELLPEGCHPGILVDHLIMLAVACGPGADSARHYAQALDLAAVIGDPDKVIHIHNNLAFDAWEAGDAENATKHVDRMLELSGLRGLPLRASALETVARVHLMNGRPEDAIALLDPVVSATSWAAVESGAASAGPSIDPAADAAYSLCTEPYALPECMRTLAEAHRMLGRFTAAHHTLNRALLLAKERGLKATHASILGEQARLYAAVGDHRRAYEQHLAFHQAVVEMHSEEEQARARIVQASFDAGEMRRDTERFRELAMRDALTGLYNRRFVDHQLVSLTAQAAGGTPLSAAIVDADRFKRINDELSHESGDRVLRILADILVSHAIPPETVGRLGGEEFVVLMPAVSAAQAHDRCETLRRAVQDHDWGPVTGSIPVTVSIGVTTAPTGATSPAALLSDADRNLYAAKRSGRNRVMGDPLPASHAARWEPAVEPSR